MAAVRLGKLQGVPTVQRSRGHGDHVPGQGFLAPQIMHGSQGGGEGRGDMRLVEHEEGVIADQGGVDGGGCRADAKSPPEQARPCLVDGGDNHRRPVRGHHPAAVYGHAAPHFDDLATESLGIGGDAVDDQAPVHQVDQPCGHRQALPRGPMPDRDDRGLARTGRHRDGWRRGACGHQFRQADLPGKGFVAVPLLVPINEVLHALTSRPPAAGRDRCRNNGPRR